MAAKPKPEFPKLIKFESGRVRIAQRSNGKFALSWRENGGTQKTTKSSKADAIEWAEAKARELDAGQGKAWISAADRDALQSLKKIAGEGEGAIRRLLEDTRGALAWLDGHADLTAAARYYAERGPLKVLIQTASGAVKRFLGEYRDQNLRTYKTELDAFLAIHPALSMLEITEEILTKWVFRKVRPSGKKDLQEPAPRTLNNRITTWITFLNRARDWKMLPANDKHPAELLRKPVIPDVGKKILTIHQGERMLAAIRKKTPKLESFFIIAGWLGLRPSECQRLRWELFDWEKGYLHVDITVALKTSQERYVPMDVAVKKRLRELYDQNQRLKKPRKKACLHRSREMLSQLARDEKILAVWDPDILRHSFCSYRLAVTQNINQVAEEAGNSPPIIRKSYRKPVLPEEGRAWWQMLAA